jgi:hypothetical protein
MPTNISGSTGVDNFNDTAFITEVKSNMNVTGDAPMYACRAWVNFNGTGTVAIRASGNVSSITDNGTGDYTVNFTTAMPDANYVFCGNNSTANGVSRASGDDNAVAASGAATGVYTVSAHRLGATSNGSLEDSGQVTVAYFI